MAKAFMYKNAFSNISKCEWRHIAAVYGVLGIQIVLSKSAFQKICKMPKRLKLKAKICRHLIIIAIGIKS